MKQLLKNLVMIAIAISTIMLVSCGDDEEPAPEPIAGFIATINQETGVVSFENTSENATIYSWDFGDGSDASTAENPTHTYDPGDYTVTLTASNEDGDSDTSTDEITVTDATAPVITLSGDEPVCLNVGDTYTDPGATATDDVDGDISSSIVVDASAVDTSTPGIYEVTYNVSDAEGNAATEVVRGVVVSAVFNVEGNLVTNGDFSNGDTGWTGNQGALEIRTEGCSDFFFANVATAGASFDVNLQQIVELEQGATYTLSFDANSDGSRSIIAGLGMSVEPFSSVTETVSLTVDPQTFVLEGLIPGFGGVNSRVFFDLGAETGVVIIDNISLVKTADAPETTGPTVSAPVPSLDGAEVISIYSDSYTDLPNINYDPNWGQSGHMQVNTQYDPGDGNLVLAYPNFTYQGTDLGGNQDFSAMNTLHIDIWVAGGTDRQVKVSPISATGVTEVLVPVTLTPGSWSSVDIPIGSFSGMTWDAIKEIKFDGQFNGDGTANTAPFDIYLDNIYFWNDPNNGGGGSPGENLATNGDFEAGDVSGWQNFPAATSTFTAETDNPAGGTFSGRINNTDLASSHVVKQANLAIGTVAVGDVISISFDIRGTLEAGGVVNIEFFEEITPEGVSRSELLGGGPIVTLSPGTWETKTYTTTVTTDVSNGITLQIGAATGGAAGSKADIYIDNVVIAIVE